MKKYILLFYLLCTSTHAKIHFGAEKIIYLPSSKKVILIDSAWTFDANNKLFADSIVYLDSTKLLKAFGDALLIIDKDSFRGDSLYYNTESKTGYAFSGYTLKEKGKIWGEAAYKDSTDNIYIKHGFYTTCDKDPPHYFFQSSYMKIVQKEMAIARPVILKVHNVPLFYVPFWMFPVKKGRKSGFLTPSIGYNSANGKYFRNLAYYLVLNNYMDITVSADIIENVGVKGNINLVYKLYKHLGGNIQYSRAENLWPRRTEWSIKGWHRQNLPYHINLSARANYMSSYDYLNQYSESVVQWLKREMYSYITLSRNLPPLSFNITIDDRLKPDAEERESMLPSVQYYLPPFPFFNMRFWGSFLRKRYKDSVNVRYTQGIQNSLSATYNINILRYIRTQMMVSSAINILPQDSAMQRYVLQKSVKFSSGLSTTLYGFSVFGFSPLNIKKFIHVVSPSISFNYTPFVPNDSVSFQYGSLYRKGRSLSISINNMFFARGDSFRIKLIDIRLSTSYDFEKNKFNNIPVSFSLSEKLPFRIRGGFLYNTDSNRIENKSVYISSNRMFYLPETSFISSSTKKDSQTVKNSSNKFDLSFTYTLSKSAIFTTQTAGISAGYRISPSLSGNLSISYDLAHGKYLHRSLSLKKDLHCWELTFTYNKYGNIWDYSFRLFIKKIPDVKIDKGFFKDLLP